MHDFQARMAAGKQTALEARNEGGSTVKVYRTTNEMLHALGRIEPDNFDHWLATVRDRVVEIVEHSRFTIYGEQWGEFQ